MPVRRRRAGWVLVASAMVGVAACGGSGGTHAAGSTSATTSAADSSGAADRLLVVLGDSIPYGGHFCPGCTAFPDSYGTAIQQATGHLVKVQNHSRDDSARLQDIEDQLRDDTDVKGELAKADVVLISVGFNNTPPWPAGNPCGGQESDDLDTQVSTVLRYPPTCIARAVQTYRASYDRIYSAIAAIAPKTATLIAVNVYNSWIGYPDLRASASTATLRRLTTITKRVYDDWNSMLCTSATQHGFACVDIYHAFNGRTGLGAPGPNVQTEDYTHPSQAGNDLIASLLAKVPLKSG